MPITVRNFVRALVVLGAFITGATGGSAQQKFNPATQIAWPTNCLASGLQVYNYLNNTCVPASPSVQPIVFRGTWSSGTTYAANDAVFYSGNQYISLQGSNLNQNPATAGTYWALLISGDVTAANMQAALVGQTGCTTAGYAWNPATNTCTAASAGVVTFNLRSGPVTLAATDVQSALTALTGCSTAGAAYNPQSNSCSILTAAAIASAIASQTGCTTAGYVWVPQSNTCVAQSAGGGAVGPAGSVQIQGPTSGTPVASDNTTLLNGLTVQEYTNAQHPPLAYWDAAFHLCRNQVVNIIILGDSRSIVDKTVTPGAGTLGVDFNLRWARRLENYLQSPSICGSAGQGIVPFRWGTGTFSTQGFNADYYTVTGGYTATDIALGPYQPGSSDPMTVTGNSTSTPINFSPPQPFDHLQMIARVGAGLSPWTLKIDSSVVGTCGGAGSTSAVLCTSSAVPLGSHTASATCLSGTCEGYGLGTTAGTSGVRIINAAVGGASAEVQGQFPATQFAYSDLITPQALTIIYHVTNEPGQGISPTQFNTTLGNIITHQQALSPPPSTLIFSAMLDNDFPVAQQDFYPFLLSNARTFQTAYTDLRNRWSPPPTIAPAFLFGSDYIHENNIGNGEVYSAILATLIDVPSTVPVVTPALFATKFVCANTQGQFVSQSAPCADIDPASCGTGYAHAYSVSIPAASILGGADLANYPLALAFNGAAANSITLANLKVAGSGGQVQLSSGVDVQFCTSSTPGAGTTLPYELEAGTYVPSTGAGVWDVLIPVASHTSPTLIYMFVGKASASDTSNASLLWTTAHYAFVSHLGDGSLLSLTDSTGNGNTLVNTGTATPIGGVLSGGVAATTSQYLGATANAVPSGSSPRTIEAWVNLGGVAPGNALLFGYGNDATNEEWVTQYFSGAFTLYSGGLGGVAVPWTPDSNYHQLAVTLPTGQTSSSGVVYYLDGAPQAGACVGDCSTAFATSASNVQINGFPSRGLTLTANESVDEMRISTVGRTDGWFATEYSNFTNSTAFQTITNLF